MNKKNIFGLILVLVILLITGSFSQKIEPIYRIEGEYRRIIKHNSSPDLYFGKKGDKYWGKIGIYRNKNYSGDMTGFAMTLNGVKSHLYAGTKFLATDRRNWSRSSATGIFKIFNKQSLGSLDQPFCTVRVSSQKPVELNLKNMMKNIKLTQGRGLTISWTPTNDVVHLSISKNGTNVFSGSFIQGTRITIPNHIFINNAEYAFWFRQINSNLSTFSGKYKEPSVVRSVVEQIFYIKVIKHQLESTSP